MKLLEGKVVVLGMQGVGKTSMVVRYIAKKFQNHVSPTIGASFFTCRITVGDTKVKLQVWDTAGQERFRAMAPMYYRNANAAILVFDITKANTFDSVKIWVKELLSNVRDPMVLSLVGNKLDLANERVVSIDEASLYAQSIGATYYESSALHDQGVEQLFLSTATELVKLSGQSVNTTLKSYDFYGSGTDDVLTPTANCSTLHATDVGKTEGAPWSIDSIAHADSEKPMCC